MNVLIAAVCAAFVVSLLIAAPAEPRLRAILGTAESRPARAFPIRVLASAAAAAGVLVLVPLPWSLAAALGVWWMVPRMLGRLESRSERGDREALARQAPAIADLLAATLASGAPLTDAVGAVGRAMGEPASTRLASVEAALRLGADPVEAWRTVAEDQVLAPLAQAVHRSMRTGAPLAHVLARIAEDMRRMRQRDVETAARVAGVRAVAPLAACFLPAFMLLGVVPVVASLATGLLD